MERIQELTKSVEEASLKVAQIVGRVSVAPDAGELQNCKIDAAMMGLTFRTDPERDLFIDTAAEEPVGIVVVSGGKPPYNAMWVGNLPGKKAMLEPVDHNAPGENRAVIRIRAAQKADGDFHVLVNDQSIGRSTISVHLTPHQPQGAKSPDSAALSVSDKPRESVSDTRRTSVPDETIRRIQMALIQLGCLARDTNGKTNADGRWGDRTETALNAFKNALKKTFNERAMTDFEKVIGRQTQAENWEVRLA